MIKQICTILALMLISTVSAGAETVDVQKKKKTPPPRPTGATFTEKIAGIDFVRIKGGCFNMGGEKEKPVHQRCVGDFYLGKTEVTQGQWEKLMKSNPSHFSACGPDCPVESVSWEMAQDFLKALNSATERDYRLPTEAEWEYAAKGGKEHIWAGAVNEGDIEKSAWIDKNSGATTNKVAGKSPNPFGLYDMSGNVWEWCQDRYSQDYYGTGPKNDPKGPDAGDSRVLRGGSWDDPADDARTAFRYQNPENARGPSLGLRLVLPAK